MAGWNADAAYKLDNEERRKILPPAQTLKKLGLAEGMNFADIGCGIGYFTLPAAHMIGKNAQAFAADVSAEMLAILTENAEREKIKNITVVRTDEYDLKMEGGKVDFALCCNVLHEVPDRERFACEMATLLCPGGILAVIEWKKIKTKRGPLEEERIEPGVLKKLLKKCGLSVLNEIDVNEDLYALAAKK